MLTASGVALVGCSSVVAHTSLGPGDAGTVDGVVTVYGDLPFEQAELLRQSWADWEKDSGITIDYESIGDFDTAIAEQAEAGTAPDLALLPGTGLLTDLAWRNLIQPVPAEVEANLEQYWSSDWVQASTVADVVYGAPLLTEVKGLVWFSPRQFTAHGLRIPTTWAGLVNLTSDLRAKLGTAPWCVDFGSDAATGALGADWLEGMVLSQAGAFTYDAWVRHDVAFSDPAITGALDAMGSILLNPEYVRSDVGDSAGGGAASDTALALAMGDGTCALTLHDMNFGETLADPDAADLTVSPTGDVWAFVMPSLRAGGNSVTGTGQLVAAFSNDAETAQVQRYLSSPAWANSRVELGGAVSANNGVDAENASSALLTKLITVLQDQRTTFRFDASDDMPAVVGAGTFPEAMGMWAKHWSPDQMMSTIDRSWPVD